MRVLFCSYPTVSLPGSGVRRVIIKTKEYLEARGIEVTLFDPWVRQNWAEIDLVHSFVSDMRNYYLYKALPDDKPLVVAPLIDTGYSVSILKLFRLLTNVLPTPLLTSYRSHDLAFHKADAVLACSSHERRILEQSFGVSPIKIYDVPNGVDAHFLKAKPDVFVNRYGLRDFVLYTGQIGNPRKNLKRLLHVAGQMPRVDFVMIGHSLPTQEARETVELARSYPNVHLLGHVSEEELLSAYGACKVLALPSLIEATGLVALEAGLAGAQVVITQHGGTRHYFGSLAHYVNPRSEESIRAAIEAALAAPRDDRLREHIASHFLWEIIAEQLDTIYHQVVAARQDDGGDQSH